MTYTSSFTEHDMNELNELQNKMVQSISHFSETCRISIKDNNFLLNLVNQISDLRVEFRKFAEESIAHNLNMLTYAKDLIVFAECCEDDGIDKDDLLKLLRPLLSNSKLYKAKVKLLKNQLKRISISLYGIVKEIFEYDEKFIREQESLSNIVYMIMYMNGNFIKGASSAVVPAAKAVVGLSLVILGSAAAVTVSTVVAENVKEQFSQYLREMRNGFSNIICGTIIYCESYWENKIEEIKCFAGKLELLEQRILILITRSIVLKAKKILANSESYNDHMRQILNRDSILA
ncbi:hypothetical protein RhiirA5_496650 [Rhizophagus irregularis]|nr:hypothetical protein RhiirA5_496650 [Rhizophagus irregularis]GBC50279.1 hypothetical protein GLOIN_2v1721295 [Rhizophagus irregularis DAOM 181602=DAOM 197198]PKY31455.1 hypothetical protein RhiirB3_531593 [Rhizophagus irregularis]UZO25034.1 hypothetical protein OCT59_017321 [Rhizophagus irregularis]CAB4374581.1 unnamed protein product [Rhizophagus irregularis]